MVGPMLATVTMANIAQPATSFASDCPVLFEVLTFKPPLNIWMVGTQLAERMPADADGLVRTGSAMAFPG